MKKCDCYHIQPEKRLTYKRVTGEPIVRDVNVGVCWGTKERDKCSCNGWQESCDFYPEVREKARKEVIKRYVKMHWNVMLFDRNQGKLVPYNIFDNSTFSRDIQYILASANGSREDISEVLDRAALHSFWGQCEYEFIASDWPPSGREEKISVYDQLRCNWDRFVDYVMSYKE